MLFIKDSPQSSDEVATFIKQSVILVELHKLYGMKFLKNIGISRAVSLIIVRISFSFASFLGFFILTYLILIYFNFFILIYFLKTGFNKVLRSHFFVINFFQTYWFLCSSVNFAP